MSPRRLPTVLKELREAHGWTQEQIATRAQVRQSYLAMLESGERKNPSLDVLKRLAKALKVAVTDLLE
jgi:XRE family transcriptional regulator, regulator of sulfur utilization